MRVSGLRLMGGALLALAAVGCTRPQLPPAAYLESPGCKVWWWSDQAVGYYATVTGPYSELHAGERTVTGPALLDTGEFEFHDQTFGEYHHGIVRIEQIFARLPPADPTAPRLVVIEGGEQNVEVFYNAHCHPDELALGVLAAIVVIHEDVRPRFDPDRHAPREGPRYVQ